MRNNKKVVTALVVSVVALAVLISSSVALFTDAKEASLSGKAGTVKIALVDNSTKFTHKYKNATAPNNINPGDNDPKNPDDANPGTDHIIEFEVRNQGNKSVATRHMIVITASKVVDGTTVVMDPTMFFLADLSSGKPSKIEPKPENIIKDGSGKPIAVKYEFYPSDIFNGVGTNAEIETGGITNKAYQYHFAMDRNADNTYQGVDVKIDIIVEAMQYRNTTLTDWKAIASRTVTINSSVSIGSVPMANQDKNGNNFPS